MPGTFLSLHYHVVFSTKNRDPSLVPSILPRMHEYLGGTVKGLKGIPEAVGGVADHVHLLVGLPATCCLSDFMRELKKASSFWMHTEIKDPGFAWQEGYAAFTVSATSRKQVKRYIAKQDEHHRNTPFREELIAMLRRANVPFEECYLD